MKRKSIALLSAAAMVFSAAVCSCAPDKKTEQTDASVETNRSSDSAQENSSAVSADISLWTFPVGAWGDPETVEQIISGFHQKYPNINVTAEFVDYTEGDAKIEEAKNAGSAPDLVLEGPERLVNWGFSGWMADLNDLWDDAAVEDISGNNLAVLAACMGSDGNYYEYPLCMNAHCMAINQDLFEAAGAMQYIDTTTRTWTTENFEKALRALKAYGVETPGVVYCGGQGGDQGTRALAMNLYSAQFTNGAHTKWTMDSKQGIDGIRQLADWCKEGILSYDDQIVAADELAQFADGQTAMTFCWNASNMANYIDQISFTPYAVAFPSDDGIPELAGGIYGFGVFDNGDPDKIEAAKLFIEYVCNDPAQADESVRASGFFGVKASAGNIYEGTPQEETMKEFASLMPYLGDYYNVTSAWAQQRTAWWTMLQEVFAGEDVEEKVKSYVEVCNDATMAVLKGNKK